MAGGGEVAADVPEEPSAPQRPEDGGLAERLGDPQPDPGAEVARSRWSDGCDVAICDVGACDTVSCDSAGCDGCDAPDCGFLMFVRVSTVLAVVALVVPRRAGGTVLALLRFYRRRLTRYTPACPSQPSCSAYAVAAVQAWGPRRGLAEAGRRVRACGRATTHPAGTRSSSAGGRRASMPSTSRST